ncbi:hypothetical protein GDO78_012820 [Eleutherodactylus coqui]|nr:hypothetical protein GDO78_012820 [Eleutherodactylus coqui]
MVEHLAGFRHRKLYLARVYPYVLKAQASSKEDQSRFIRRMALEIEREEGAKKYMVDNSIWMESMMTLRAADKRMIERRTRWEERTDPTRVKKALNYLGMFEIESEIEATTVTRLCEKLTANLRVYSNYPRQDALFPARVVRAQDVVKSLLQNAVKQRTCVQNPMQKKEKPQAPPKFNKRPPPHPENASLRHKAGMQRGHPGANSKNINARENMPTKPPYKQAQKYPSGPLKKRQEKTEPSMPQRKETPQKAEKPDQSFLKNISQEDTQFFKKLMALLDVLPRSVSPPETTEDSSNLLMLKSLLAKEKNAEHEQANSKMMMQIASIMQDTLSAQNASLNQQLMLMTSQNSTAMVMQTASTGGFVPGIHGLGTVQANVNSLMPFNQSFASQTYGQMEVNASGPTNPNAYQGPMQSYSGPPQSYSGPPQSYSGPPQSYSGPPQNCDDFGYGNSMVGNYVAQGNPNDTQHDGIDNSLTTRQNERKRIPHTDVDYESSAPETRYADRSEEDAAYTRVRLSPSSRRIPYDSNDDTRREIRTQDQRRRERSRSYSADGWDEQEEDMRYSKRPRLGMDNQSHRSESVTDQLLESLGINSADIPPELLRRIQGKDLFTASAIISEYSESRFGK